MTIRQQCEFVLGTHHQDQRKHHDLRRDQRRWRTRSIATKDALDALQDRLAPAEGIFFTWLTRVFIAATLVGSGWIDDAPPLRSRPC